MTSSSWQAYSNYSGGMSLLSYGSVLVIWGTRKHIFLVDRFGILGMKFRHVAYFLGIRIIIGAIYVLLQYMCNTIVLSQYTFVRSKAEFEVIWCIWTRRLHLKSKDLGAWLMYEWYSS